MSDTHLKVVNDVREIVGWIAVSFDEDEIIQGFRAS